MVKATLKRVSLTYTHSTSFAATPAPPATAPPSRTALDCSVTFDPANKVTLSHALGSGGCRLKYTYAHGADRLTTVEPVFDTNKNAWEFAVTKKFVGGDTVKGTYAASTKLFGLEWTRDSIYGGSFKGLVWSGEEAVLRWIARMLRRWKPMYTQEVQDKLEVVIAKLEELASLPPRICWVQLSAVTSGTQSSDRPSVAADQSEAVAVVISSEPSETASLAGSGFLSADHVDHAV